MTNHQGDNPGESARRRAVEQTERLSEAEFRVLREKGTEPPFSGRYVSEKRKGRYRCAGCGEVLYESKAKFDSGTGWPSFYEAASEDSLRTEIDTNHGMTRVEILCARCNGHLGHLFDDGPAPTGMRHCVNSAALRFEPEK